MLLMLVLQLQLQLQLQLAGCSCSCSCSCSCFSLKDAVSRGRVVTVRQGKEKSVSNGMNHRKFGACSWLPGLVQKAQPRASWSASFMEDDLDTKNYHKLHCALEFQHIFNQILEKLFDTTRRTAWSKHASRGSRSQFLCNQTHSQA